MDYSGYRFPRKDWITGLMQAMKVCRLLWLVQVWPFGPILMRKLTTKEFEFFQEACENGASGEAYQILIR